MINKRRRLDKRPPSQEYYERFRRRVYVTPRSYLSFIAGFKALYAQKLGAVRALASSVASGLTKMNEAKEGVARMQVSTMLCSGRPAARAGQHGKCPWAGA
jgi:hypothetical protein